MSNYILTTIGQDFMYSVARSVIEKKQIENKWWTTKWREK